MTQPIALPLSYRGTSRNVKELKARMCTESLMEGCLIFKGNYSLKKQVIMEP